MLYNPYCSPSTKPGNKEIGSQRYSARLCMLYNPYCSPSTSRATKKSEANYFLPGLVKKGSFPAWAGILLAFALGFQGCVASLGPTPAAPHASPDRARLMTVTSLPPRNSGGLWPFEKDELGPSLADRAESELDLLTERASKLKAAGSQYIEIWIPWSEAEPEPGRFEFGKFERLLSAVVATGQKVEITLASSMYPAWFYDSVLAADAGRNLLWYWDDGGPSPQAVPETALGAHHQFNPRRVQAPPLSFWAPPDAKAYIRRFVDRAFQDLLDKWAPAVLYFHFSLGRLNEPIYPDRLHFWCYDPNAVLDFRARMETRYRTIGALNEAWRTRYADFSEVRPPVPPFAGIRAAQMTDFLAWYRDSKRRWVLEATGWVQAHLQPWQKNLVYVAGGSGDIELAEQGWTYLDMGPGLDWAEPKLDMAVKDTIRAMEDNFWIVRTAKESNWALQYGGIGGLNEATGELALCNHNPVCREVPRYARAVGFTGPIYAQIPALSHDFRQPEFVAEQIYAYDCAYHGLHWTNDENLFGDQDAPRLQSLERAWRNIQLYFGTDARPPAALQVREEVTESSVEVSWTTDEPTEGFVLYGLSARRLDRLSSLDGLKTEHRVSLEKPAAGATCYFLVFATDAFGNSSVGTVRSFVVQ